MDPREFKGGQIVVHQDGTVIGTLTARVEKPDEGWGAFGGWEIEICDDEQNIGLLPDVTFRYLDVMDDPDE